ncbi:Protein RER1 [Astathelohania contejeani]|uniref:Protein RER1 n=1 Tax=Astathelohania contejeani TaxID=164912 RepID=A0ABQ7HYN0_9MICR|nr:Protein RER1 [Thelohania contejeani]
MKWYSILQIYLDKLVPLKTERWLGFVLLLILYTLRILIKQSHYLITYCLAIYLLHGLIGFCTPRQETIPDPFENYTDDDYTPQPIDDEFRPFIRRLPEYDFWMFSTKLVLICLFATFFDFIDIPVYAPILIIYFILISALTAKNLYQHMKKYNYNPFYSYKDVYGKY